jgi:hypothetical protein
MENTQELLKQINWFLKPISDFIVFLFTTKTGYFILLLFLILYMIFTIGNSLRVRKLNHQAISPNYRTPFFEKLYVVFSELMKAFLGIFSKAPVLIGMFLILFGIVGLSNAFSTIDEFVENQKRIKELKAVVKNLDKSYIVAKLEITNVDVVNNTTSLNVHYYDYALDDYLKDYQSVTIKGKDIYFLNYVMNFEYSEIESGEKINLVVPYKIFSEVVPKDEGVVLQNVDSTGVPYVFYRDNDEIYGMDSLSYYNRLKELAEYMTNPEKARKDGVRSFYAAAPHYVNNIKKGMKIIVWVEQTGGLVLKEERLF